MISSSIPRGRSAIFMGVAAGALGEATCGFLFFRISFTTFLGREADLKGQDFAGPFFWGQADLGFIIGAPGGLGPDCIISPREAKELRKSMMVEEGRPGGPGTLGMPGIPAPPGVLLIIITAGFPIIVGGGPYIIMGGGGPCIIMERGGPCIVFIIGGIGGIGGLGA